MTPAYFFQADAQSKEGAVSESVMAALEMVYLKSNRKSFQKPPIDPIEIASNLAIDYGFGLTPFSVKSVSPDTLNGSIMSVFCHPYGGLGRYKKESGSVFIILYSNELDDTIAPFVIARGMCHALLGHLMDLPILSIKNLSANEDYEKEANVMAASLLVPGKLLFDSVKDEEKDLEKLSQEFSVTMPVMGFRSKQLGYTT